MNKYIEKQPVRYLLSGALTFVVENVSFAAGYYLIGFGYVRANVLSVAVALTVNFFATKNYVFRGKKKSAPPKQFVMYTTLVLVNLLISTKLIGFLITEELPGYMAKFFTTALVVSWTYIIYKKVIFVRRKT